MKVRIIGKRSKIVETWPMKRLEEFHARGSSSQPVASIPDDYQHGDPLPHPDVEENEGDCPLSESLPTHAADLAPRPQPRTACSNAAERSNWEGAFSELIWQYTAMQGSKAQAGQHAMIAGFLRSAVHVALKEQLEHGCKFCGVGGDDCWPPFPKRSITFVDMGGSVELAEPHYRCCFCQQEHVAHPLLSGYFPAPLPSWGQSCTSAYP